MTTPIPSTKTFPVQDPLYLKNSKSSSACFQPALGETTSGLERAIALHTEAVRLTPDRHPHKPGYLNNLGNSFFARFEFLRELGDLEQAIRKYSDAIHLTTNEHPHKPRYLNNLGNSLRARFQRLGGLSDLEEAICRHRNAVDLTPDGHSHKPDYLNNLGDSFIVRFERFREPNDLETAISRYRHAIDLTSDGHPEKPRRLRNLCKSLLARFQHLGQICDLEEVVLLRRGVVDLTPDSYPDKPFQLCNFGNSLFTRFECLGDISDLEEAISVQLAAVDATPDDRPDKCHYLNNLGASLLARFEYLGDPNDLKKAISRYRVAVDFSPDGHSEKHDYLNDLSTALLIRFDRLGEQCDFGGMISTCMGIINVTPDDHPDKPRYLNHLGNSYLVRFLCLGKELSDLDNAILQYGNAVDLAPDGHPDKPRCLSNLGNSFLTRFGHLGEPKDLEEAISRLRDAVAFTPDAHPSKPLCLIYLGNALRARYRLLGKSRDLEQAISQYSNAACAPTTPTLTRIRACEFWISHAPASDSGSYTLPCAYSVATGLLPWLAWIQLPLGKSFHEFIQSASAMVREAAATAIDLGLPESAVELLEQGRSVVLGEIFQFHRSHEDLSSVYPAYARRLQKLSTACEADSIYKALLSSHPQPIHHTKRRTTQSLTQEATRRRALTTERDELLQEIRGLPGFERFLLHREFSQLRALTHAGPVVVLNAARRHCDAFIVLADNDCVVHVPLPNITLERLEDLCNAFKRLTSRVHGTLRGRMKLGTVARSLMPISKFMNWQAVLSVLWEDIVTPVLDALYDITPGTLSRIFWCPTGPFTCLPIHAAGLYGTEHSKPWNKLSDFVVSSYIPTLTSLPPPKLDVYSGGDLRLLAVGQPPSDGQHPLPGVESELGHIRKIIRDSPSSRTTCLEPSVGTVEEVLSLMRETDWVHFACHGTQNIETLTDGGLFLSDERRLKLSDLAALSRPPDRGGLAFLSVCEAARGDNVPFDEAIHIAAAMLFAGYEGVVAAMWAVSDTVAPRIVKDVYEQLFRDSGARPDHREAARALQDAVGRLRDSGASFEEWIPFIHMGI